MSKKGLYTTSIGTAMYPKLIEPDTKFNEAGVYSVKLILSREAAQPLLDRIEDAKEEAVELFKEKGGKGKPKWQDMPCGPVEDEEGMATGDWQFNIKMKASGVNKQGNAWTRKPVIFDAKGTPIKGGVKPWSGTKMKVAMSVDPFYVASKCGVTLRLEAVQIIELVEGGGGTADQFGFGAEDGYEYEEETQGQNTSAGPEVSQTKEQDDEDVPF